MTTATGTGIVIKWRPTSATMFSTATPVAESAQVCVQICQVGELITTPVLNCLLNGVDVVIKPLSCIQKNYINLVFNTSFSKYQCTKTGV